MTGALADAIESAARVILDSGYVVALIGAGLSTESGIPTFRGPGGLWTRLGEPSMRGCQQFLQDPAAWWHAAQAAIHSALATAGATGEEIRGIGLTGQMHGLALLDSDDQILRPAILWNDQRTSAECDEVRQRVGRERLISITGNDA